ncbi:MAG: hypothetical protein AB8G14_07115 [Ilumatobacter sp.]
MHRAWYLDLPALVVIAATGLGALAGGGLLHIATRLPSVLIGLLGAALATGSAWVITDYSAERSRGPHRRSWVAFVRVCGVVGLILVIVSERQRWPFPAFVGLMALTVALAPFIGEVRTDRVGRAQRWMQGGMFLSFAAVTSFAVPGLPGAARLVAAALVLAGIGGFTGGLASHIAAGQVMQAPMLKLIPGSTGARGVAIGIVGLALTVGSLTLGSGVAALVGAWLVLISLISLSVQPQRFGLSPTMHRTILGGGVGLVLVAGYQLLTTDVVGRSAAFLVSVVAIAALSGAWIVMRGATLFIAVLGGFVLVWGLFSNVVANDVAGGGRSETASVVALGDSFISGEGARRFFEGTDQKGDERNECRRAPTAYPALIATAGSPTNTSLPVDGLSNSTLEFVACSGAKLAQVLDTTPDDGGPSNTGRDLPCSPDDPLAVGQYPCGEEGLYGSRLQIDHLTQRARDGAELVLVSIGGNDVRFGDVVAGCLLPGSCAERREVWLDNVTALGPELTKGYSQLREAFGSGGASIVVMPYPLVLTEDTCAGSPLDASEHEFIYEFTTVLNQQLAASAAQAGVHFYADGVFSFEGHRLCEAGDRAINLIGLQPTDGPLLDRLNPGSWTHNSMHPNELGHSLIAVGLTEWLNANRIVGGVHPEPEPGAVTQLLGVRPTRPYAVAPTALAVLRERPVDGCDFAQLSSFATRVSVFDEQSDTDEEVPFRVPISGADPSAVICATDSNGRWVAITPIMDGDGTEMNMATEQPVASVQDGQVIITGGRPTADCPPADQDDGVCAFQWVLFAPPIPEAEPGVEAFDGDERVWSLRAVRYCSTDPDCASSFDDWTAAQIGRAARKVVPPLALIAFGGWLTALGWHLMGLRPFSRRIEGWVRARLLAQPHDAV